ncbi:unnamed protein product [Arctogadus glacialis]
MRFVQGQITVKKLYTVLLGLNNKILAADCGGVDDTIGQRRGMLIFKITFDNLQTDQRQRRQSMKVLSGPLVDLTLLLRQTDGSMPFAFLGLVLFVSVCLLLCQLIVYIWWKLGQVDELSVFPQDRGAIFRPLHDTASAKRRSVWSQYSYTAQQDSN